MSTAPRFHEYMSEMGIEIEHEYERNGVQYIVGTDLKGRRFVTPKEWLAKPHKKKLFPVLAGVFKGQ